MSVFATFSGRALLKDDSIFVYYFLVEVYSCWTMVYMLL
ncbi:hypothetical protein B4099_1793 [Heyndrickxia coagulans]|uniref:Uncharacterized protein n=1 Tax=Heyndrickxia coagulans TaxID=1398 RepID=A0A150KEP8_HEYCO|nr:hypothetical protein B4099_1793 [Heyndrickxia coagulans]